MPILLEHTLPRVWHTRIAAQGLVVNRELLQQQIRQLALSMNLYFKNTATTEIYTLSLHDALPILFILLKELISETLPLGKTMLQYCYLVEVKDLDESSYPTYINKYLKEKKYEIDKKACEELLIRTDYNLNLLMQELEKLMLFKFDDKKINLRDVEVLVSKNLEENIYELTNSILDNNNKKTVEIYYDLIANSEDPIRILSSISNKIRQLIVTKKMLEKRYNQDQIKDHFGIKSGAAYYLIKDANRVSYELLESMLEKLSNLDFDIKMGKIDKKIGLEILILGV